MSSSTVATTLSCHLLNIGNMEESEKSEEKDKSHIDSASRESSSMMAYRRSLPRNLQDQIHLRAQTKTKSRSRHHDSQRRECFSSGNQFEKEPTPFLASKILHPYFFTRNQHKEKTSFKNNEQTVLQKSLDEVLRNKHYLIQKFYVNSRTESSLYDAIKNRCWSKAISFAQSNPEMCRYQSPQGFYPLHCACFIGSCPFEVVFALVEAYPEAVNLRNSYPLGDTPLHAQARNCQRTSSRMKILLNHANLRLRDRFGNTALHIACGTNSIIDVMYDLITKDSTLVNLKNNNGETPLESLWSSFLQSIPGHLAVARILSKKSHETTGSFGRFWNKVKLIVLGERLEEGGCLLGHRMLQLKVPPKMLHLATVLDSSLSSHPDKDGNYLLHSMILQRFPFETTIFNMTTNKKALEARNIDGETTLSLSLKKYMLDYVSPIVGLAPELLVERDGKTSIYPFQLAAAMDCSLDVIFRLLITRPDVAEYSDN